MSKNDISYSIERVTLDGVEILLTPTSDPNEAHLERIFAAFAAIDQSERPSIIISTTTPMM